MNIAIWSQEPPQYEFYKENTYRVIYNVIPFEEEITHIDEETGETVSDIIQSYKVHYELLQLPELTEAINNNNEQLINKILLQQRIKLWDISTNVNEFTINGVSIWLDKSTRVGLKLRFESELAQNNVETTLWYGKIKFTLNLEEAINMLYAIEDYASKCYDCTQQHYLNIESLEMPIEFQNYDYKSGYPEKLQF